MLCKEVRTAVEVLLVVENGWVAGCQYISSVKMLDGKENGGICFFHDVFSFALSVCRVCYAVNDGLAVSFCFCGRVCIVYAGKCNLIHGAGCRRVGTDGSVGKSTGGDNRKLRLGVPLLCGIRQLRDCTVGIVLNCLELQHEKR